MPVPLNARTSQDLLSIGRDAIVASATGTFPIFTAFRPFRVDALELISDAGVAANGSNYFTFLVRVGGRSVATVATSATAIVAATPLALTLATESGQNRVAAKGDVVDIVATLTGTLTITNLRVVVHGRYVG